MIEGIIGLPGDGKSYLAVEWIIERLVEGRSFVVTSIPLKLPELRAFVVAKLARRRGFKEDTQPYDLDENLKVISKTEAFEFYRYRSGGLVLDESPDRRTEGDRNMAAKRIGKELLIEYMDKQFDRMTVDAKFCRPVDYFIDEAHNTFSSREWQTNGRSTLYYASQHRHLHDNVFLITQAFGNVESQLRSLVAETHVCRNHAVRSIGPFKMRPVFVVRSYYGHEPAKVSPYAVMKFSLDVVGVGACYESTGALGVHKNAEAKKNKGFLPWWSALAMGAVGVVLLTLLVGYGPRVVFRKIFPPYVPPKAVQAPGAAAAAAARRADASESEVLVLDGVSAFADRSCLLHPVGWSDWVPGKVVAAGKYLLDSGEFARLETVSERRERVRSMVLTEDKPNVESRRGVQ